MNVLIQHYDAGVVEEPGSVDPYQVVFRPANPVLDAVVAMWGPLSWLDRRRQSQVSISEKEREEFISLIPDGINLYEVRCLFHAAEHRPAPEPWLHVALGLWLASTPEAANVHDGFRCGVADSIYRDPSVWGTYGPGYSPTVVAQAIREMRKRKGKPSAAHFLASCAKHRAMFKRWCEDIDTIAEIIDQSGSPLAITAVTAQAWGPDNPDYIPFDE